MLRRPVSIRRNRSGVPHINAATEEELYYGVGYSQARDRGMQLLLMRLLGKGRASECLQATKDTLEIDTFFRKMNWKPAPEEDVFQDCDEASRKKLVSFCDGINDYFSHKRPFEFKLVGYRPEPWTPQDSVLIARMTGYLTLAQSQAEAQRLFIELAQRDVEPAKLEELFPLEDYPLDLIKKIRLGSDRLVPESLRWNSPIAKLMASNNWVVSGSHTQSGKPLLANDPHLEINRLPNVWYEMVHRCGDHQSMGFCMPGMPGILLGRNRHLSWGATYSFMDAIDFWIEQTKDGRYYREDSGWIPFNERTEIIKRKKKDDVKLVFYENEHGVLDGHPQHEGHQLTMRWAGSHTGMRSLTSNLGLFHAKTVEEGQNLMGQLEVAFSWVFADTQGDIGFQMSGLMPRRRTGHNGFCPREGWKKENDWTGMVPPEELPRSTNPDSGFIVTANHDLNHLGQASPINMPMSNDRAVRIENLLREKEKLNVHDMKRIQGDLYSLQAEKYMDLLTPLLPESKNARLLSSWDRCYTKDSKGAFLFEQFYMHLLSEVFGKVFGQEPWNYILKETGTLTESYGNFDRILLNPKSAWYATKSQKEFFRDSLKAALQTSPRSWGKSHRLQFTHIFFQGKLPRLLGFDKGPYPMKGGRSTVCQGQLYKAGGRETSFFPSMRFVTDMAETTMATSLCGGPSDRRFSRWYASELKDWMNNRYKTLELS